MSRTIHTGGGYLEWLDEPPDLPEDIQQMRRESLNDQLQKVSQASTIDELEDIRDMLSRAIAKTEAKIERFKLINADRSVSTEDADWYERAVYAQKFLTRVKSKASRKQKVISDRELLASCGGDFNKFNTEKTKRHEASIEKEGRIRKKVIHLMVEKGFVDRNQLGWIYEEARLIIENKDAEANTDERT